MTNPRHSETPKARTRQEQTIDEMVEETLPASDATQLPGRAAGAPEPGAERPDPRREFRRAKPSTIGNQGVAPSTRITEETIDLGSDAVVALQYDPDACRLSLRLREGTMLDAAALDRLIETLSRKRAQMGD